MSLKGFHIVFIALSALFFFLFALWLLVFGDTEPLFWKILAAVISAGLGVTLVTYGIRFLKKFKHLQSSVG
jgi:hypothetical protein